MLQASEKPNRSTLSIPADCATRAVLGHVTNKWGTLILLALSEGTLRWNELRRALDGVSEKMLSQCLQALIADGFILREQRPTMPPHVEYSLTNLGQEVTELLVPLFERIARHTGELTDLTRPADGTPETRN
ncbi:helix-turn-helix transcriptional regulator [Arthrobacter sp. Sa2BUA2]|uniref:Helix-turn-helix transcriptional regulator n=1 Tax=Arthrobacter pullicola TaxID=2762224 RepID=A0ABR8YML6_9MICC|nr:helix-turn-helix domain-containing protein [Arthrobacter pullicola]MBD8045372.1 helix-turn-helix transcriptional regulator [Arthrobacter pullicola]